MAKVQVSSIDEFQKIVENEGKFLLFKHSLTCPISQAAFDEYERFTKSSDFSTYYLYVQDARPLSNHIAETYGIKHESPQALLFENGSVIWHASHRNITEEKMKLTIEA